ncbi:MAG: 50S ribosomal protein L6 [Alphaproteobacteria bacterium]|jgi:large subunit ribosomal protein L6|nr:50S ribosomal protein L6 [Alphaproteobacteria bacterium]MBT7942493.1 50S ribosomal protein L6 [Alphaproteobacteria bacterium]
MSRIGKNPVEIPDGVTVDVAGKIVTAKGKLGELSITLTDDVEVGMEDKLITVKTRNNTMFARKMWGTSRSIIENLVSGVSEGFSRSLEIQGVGYRAQVQGKELIMQLGFSHEIRFPIPETIKIECSDQTHIKVSGPDKQKVGQTASEIRSFRPPEPYKGKGIRYEGEYVIRKEGKKK